MKDLKDKLIEKFWAKVSKLTDKECWEWTGFRSKGYGVMSIYNRGQQHNFRAHRVSLWLIGKIDLNLNSDMTNVVDHLCRNRACVNPKHLRVVDTRTNSIENSNGISAINFSKKVCIHGHELIGDNARTLRRKNGRIHRYCLACKKAADSRNRRRYQVAKKKLQSALEKEKGDE